MTLYHGGCQCGAVRYSVDMDLGTPVTCNCSRCRRLGSRLSFAPETAFTLEQGAGELTEYQFAKHRIHHLFCRICGIQSFARAEGRDGTPMVAVNVNCLDEVDPFALETRFVDGKAS